MRLHESSVFAFWSKGEEKPAGKSRYDRAIGTTMSMVRRAPEWKKPTIKRALVHMNVARQLEKMGQVKVATMLMRVSEDALRKILDGQTPYQPDPIVVPKSVHQATGRAMSMVKRAREEDKPIAREAMVFFNLSRTVAHLGYDKLFHLLVELGENRMAMIALPADDEQPPQRMEPDMHKRLTPKRPAPPQNDPNPIRRVWTNTMHRVKSRLDDVGIVLDDVRPDDQ